MAIYRLYSCGLNGQADAFDDFEAHDDAAAIVAARGRCRGDQSELWCGDRRVATLIAFGLNGAKDTEPAVILSEDTDAPSNWL